MTALMLIVVNMKKPERLEANLHGLAMRHKNYGALPQYYPLFGEVLISTMAEYLGSDWTKELETAWMDAYNRVTKMMIAHSPKVSKQPPTRETPKAREYLQLSPEEKSILERYCQSFQRSPGDVVRELIFSLKDKVAIS